MITKTNQKKVDLFLNFDKNKWFFYLDKKNYGFNEQLVSDESYALNLQKFEFLSNFFLFSPLF